MQNFTFYNPTKIVFGEGTISQIGAETKRFGKRVLLVYGKSSVKKSGVYDQVIRSLDAAGVDVVELPGVKPNPVLSHVREGVELARQENADVVLAVGGGSVIDSSKAIAAGARTGGDVWDFFVEKATVEEALPLLSVLTLAATGSEMNAAAVVTNEETQQKFNVRSPLLFPKVSVLDPTATYTVPQAHTAYGAVDAISHLIEGYFTGKDDFTPLQDRYVEGLIRTIMESTGIILENPRDYNGRATMMWAAALAFNGLAISGIGGYGMPNHMIEHSLSAIYDIPHGAGLSIVLPGWMKYVSRKSPGKFPQFAGRLFGIKEDTPEKASESGIEALRAWFDKIGSPTSLRAANIPEEDIEKIAENATMLAKKWRLTDYTKEVIADVLRLCN